LRRGVSRGGAVQCATLIAPYAPLFRGSNYWNGAITALGFASVAFIGQPRAENGHAKLPMSYSAISACSHVRSCPKATGLLRRP